MGIREVQAGPSPVMCLHEVPRLLSAILKEGRWQLGWLPAWVEVLRGAEMARQTHQGGSLPALAHQRQELPVSRGWEAAWAGQGGQAACYSEGKAEKQGKGEEGIPGWHAHHPAQFKYKELHRCMLSPSVGRTMGMEEGLACHILTVRASRVPRGQSRDQVSIAKGPSGH